MKKISWHFIRDDAANFFSNYEITLISLLNSSLQWGNNAIQVTNGKEKVLTLIWENQITIFWTDPAGSGIYVRAGIVVIRPLWRTKNIFPLNLRLKLRQRVVRGGSSSKQRCVLVRNYVWSIWKSSKDTVTNTSFLNVCDYSSTKILRTPFVPLQVESKNDYNRLIRLHW